jgi:hypothetical protein
MQNIIDYLGTPLAQEGFFTKKRQNCLLLYSNDDRAFVADEKLHIRDRDGPARAGLQAEAGDKHRRHQAADRSYQGVSSQDVACPPFTTELPTIPVAAFLHDQDPQRTQPVELKMSCPDL